MVKVQFLTALATAVVCAAQVSARLDKTKATPGTTPMEFEGKPVLKTYGTTKKLGTNYAVQVSLNADIGLGYKSLLFWTVANQ